MSDEVITNTAWTQSRHPLLLIPLHYGGGACALPLFCFNPM
jgi:hypothetical protein